MVTADEARQLRVSKGAVNHETYKEIYSKLSNRIKLAAGRGETSLEYHVPPLIPGRPMYDISHAVRYNADKLRHAGFAVDIDADLLRVDWTAPAPVPKEKPKQKKQPPPPPPPSKPLAISQKLQELKNKLTW